jgi:hypothetical protein
VRKVHIRLAIVTGLLVIFCLVLSACAPRVSQENARGAELGTEEQVQMAAALDWNVDSDCTVCHQTAVASFSSENCEALNENNTKESCMTCHDDVSGLEKAHEAVTIADMCDISRLKESEVPEGICLSCHNQDEIIAATADFMELVDDKGTIILPHEWKTQHNADGQHDAATCSSCHKMHSGQPIAETAKNYCLTCHHDGVFECGTCHTKK